MDKVSSLAIAGLMARAVVADPLGSYKIDPSLVSVSGLSSGGFMAGQLGVAYSGTFQTGFGVFAAGPYDCARNQYYTNCMYDTVPSIAQPISTMEPWSGDRIDPIENLQNRKIYLETGTADPTVGVNPMNQLRDQLANFNDQDKVSYIKTEGAGHTFPTDFDAPGNAPCDVGSQSPFISNCGYDGAGEVLKWMYGELKPRNDGELTGSLLSFDQMDSFGATGMAATGYVYVRRPAKMDLIGTTFIANTGYTKWADTNNIIILYPQTAPDNTPRTIWGGTLLPNPNACWDWNGWYGDDADQKSGVQMTAIVNQVNQLIGG